MCSSKFKSESLKRKEGVARPQPQWSPVRPMPTDWTTNKHMPFQQLPIHLHPIPRLAIPIQQPLLDCSLWHRPQMQQVSSLFAIWDSTSPVPFSDEERQEITATCAGRGRPKSRKPPPREQVDMPQLMAPISWRSRGAAGLAKSGISMREGSNVEE